MKTKHHSLEVCFHPADYENKLTNTEYVVVITDILRFTTSVCAAFYAGVDTIIPVTDLEKAREFKKKGILVAAERDGIKSDFADFGNSPSDFTEAAIRGKSLVYSTTNGTRAIEKIDSSVVTVLGAFVNLQFVADWALEQKKNIVVLCAGWNNSASLEDTLFAGAIIETLQDRGDYFVLFDSATIALEFWRLAKNDLKHFITKGTHYRRLAELGETDILDYSTILNSLKVLPALKNGKLINLLSP